MMSGSDVCMAYARALRSAVTGTRVVTACIGRAPTRMRTPGHTGCTVDGGAECAASARRRNRVRRNAGGRVLQGAAAQMLAYVHRERRVAPRTGHHVTKRDRLCGVW